MRSISMCLVFAMCLAACGKSDKSGKEGDKAGGAAGKPAQAANEAPPKPAGPTAIAKLGIKAALPAGAKIGDGVVGDGGMIQAPDLVVGIDAASDMQPKTLDAAKEDADMYSPKNLQGEALPDGFALTFENEGGMGKNYFVNVRREISGKAYWCSTTASNPAQQANALAVCKSLQP